MALLVKLCVLLMIICFIGEAVVLSAARLTYLDPFISYNALMPGQSIDVLRDYPCQLQTIPETTVALGACQFPKGYGVSNKIALTASNQVISQMSAYDIQPDALHLGDLMLCWGELNTIINHQPDGKQILDLYWKSQMYREVTPMQFSQRIDYFLPVTYLTLWGESFSCPSGQ